MTYFSNTNVFHNSLSINILSILPAAFRLQEDKVLY